MRLNRLREEAEKVASLEFATADDSHDALEMARAACRLCTEAGLAPDDVAAQRSLGQIVRWLHARRIDEGPQRLPQAQDVAAGACRLGKRLTASRKRALHGIRQRVS